MADNNGMVQVRISEHDMRTILTALQHGSDKWSEPEYAASCETARTRLAYLYRRYQARQQARTSR